jgi:hypothetical protein
LQLQINGDVNLFKIITGISYNSPSNVDDLTFQGNTGHDRERVGFVWLNKSYHFTTYSENNDSLYISIGIWGTWETLRIYFIDDLTITLKTM